MADIRSGELAVGERIPGELELVSHHQVSRHTVRESLRLLEELGLIERHQGLGTVVTAQDSAPSYVQMVRSPAELMQYPEDSQLTVLETESVRANRALARRLDCRTGTEWTRIGAVRRQRETGVALGWSDVYVLPAFAGIAKQIGQNAQPVYALIAAEYDLDIDTVSVDIEAGLLTTALAERLDAESGSPSLIVTRRYVAREHGQFEVSISVHPAERFNYTLSLTRGWQSGGGWVQEG